MSSICIGTDNGFIIRRNGVDDYEVVYEHGTHATSTEVIGFSGVAPVTPNIINTFINVDPTQPLTSTDEGATWALGGTPTFPSGYFGPYSWAKANTGSNWTIHD